MGFPLFWRAQEGESLQLEASEQKAPVAQMWHNLALVAASALLVPLLLLLGWALYYHFSTTKIPDGTCESLKVRFLHIGLVMVFGLVS